MKNVQNLVGKTSTQFLDEIFKALADAEIVVDDFELDHICYRVATQMRYEILKKQFLDEGSLLSESIISGRWISTFKLDNPIEYKERKINILELPEPKNGSKYEEGFEHVEFVVPYNLEEFLALYSKIDFDRKGLHKEINRDFRLELGKFSVKFHEQSLAKVIEHENSLK